MEKENKKARVVNTGTWMFGKEGFLCQGRDAKPYIHVWLQGFESPVLLHESEIEILTKQKEI